MLSSFSLEEVRTLYQQHTLATGQKFTDDAIEYAFDQTQGQPYNAKVMYKMKTHLKQHLEKSHSQSFLEELHKESTRCLRAPCSIQQGALRARLNDRS